MYTPTPENATARCPPVRNQLGTRHNPSLVFPWRWQTSPRPSLAQNLVSHLLALPPALTGGTSTFRPLGGPSGERELTGSPTSVVSLGQSHRPAGLHPSCRSSALPHPSPRPSVQTPTHQMMHQPFSSLGGDDPQVRLATGGSELGAVGGRRWRLGRDALVQSAAVGHGQEPGGSPSTAIAVP